MRIFVAISFLVSAVAFGAPAQGWLKPAPASIGSWQDWTPIEVFFEVPASKLAAAEAWLAHKPYLAQDQRGLAYFGRPSFSCPATTKPYLVRAAFTNGGTGQYSLYWTHNAELVVSHGSLGPGGPTSKSALIACLPSAPKAIYSVITGAL
jgi:hypothetical protein